MTSRRSNSRLALLLVALALYLSAYVAIRSNTENYHGIKDERSVRNLLKSIGPKGEGFGILDVPKNIVTRIKNRFPKIFRFHARRNQPTAAPSTSPSLLSSTVPSHSMRPSPAPSSAPSEPVLLPQFRYKMTTTVLVNEPREAAPRKSAKSEKASSTKSTKTAKSAKTATGTTTKSVKSAKTSTARSAARSKAQTAARTVINSRIPDESECFENIVINGEPFKVSC